MGKIMIELISADDADSADLLAKAAKDYWEDPYLGYKLVSDTKGPDNLVVRKGAKTSAEEKKYLRGDEAWHASDMVILVFEKKDGGGRKTSAGK